MESVCIGELLPLQEDFIETTASELSYQSFDEKGIRRCIWPIRCKSGNCSRNFELRGSL